MNVVVGIIIAVIAILLMVFVSGVKMANYKRPSKKSSYLYILFTALFIAAMMVFLQYHP